MTFKLKPLPYGEDALEPAIGRETVSIHYHKHHAGYVSKLNDAIASSGLPGGSLETVIEEADRQGDQSIYNLAAQVWNHDFYWESMTPDRTSPGKTMKAHLEGSFSSMVKFEETFKDEALAQFGSGWTWLCWDHSGEKLQVLSTTDAVIPEADSYTPVLTLDVWEHAYYLDYQNDRAAYVEKYLDGLINWDTAGKRLEQVLAVSSQAGLRQATR